MRRLSVQGFNKKKKNIAKMLLLAAMCTCLLAACGEGGSQNSENQTVESQGQAAEEGFSKMENDVTVILTTDKKEYSAGEEIHYEMKIQNQREGYTISKIFAESSCDAALSEKELPSFSGLVATGEEASYEGCLFGPGLEAVETPKASKTALPETVEVMTFRPYVKIKVDGEELLVRYIVDVVMFQKGADFSTEQLKPAKHITCHDPSIFRDFDGTYYVFGSFLATASSSDLYDWESHDGEFTKTFTQEVRDQIKEWNADDTANGWNGYLWAPDIIYNPIMNKYCIYLSANGDFWKSNLVLLTADSVYGPYDYAGTIVYGGFNNEDYRQTDLCKVLGEDELPERYITHGVDNKKWGDEYPNCIDPCVFYDSEGKLWISYGSWSGGIFMLELDEETGLRDYSVSYETNEHSDAYFGKKVAGGKYVSGEASYIQQVGDYYYLFISYGNLEARGGYNVRIFRSENPDGPYVDALGNSALYDQYIFNYNQSVGVRLFGGYKWPSMKVGQVAQGHNSAFVDEDGKSYIVFHTRTTDGSEGHYVKVHQLFVNKEGWLVAAPFQTAGETLNEKGYTENQVAGSYDVILHQLDIDFKSLDTNKSQIVSLNEDGSISGALTGSWSLEEGTPYITLTLDQDTYEGVTVSMNIENTTVETMTFTALGKNSQITIWGSKRVE